MADRYADYIETGGGMTYEDWVIRYLTALHGPTF